MGKHVHYDYLLLPVTSSHFTYELPPNQPIILGENPQIGLKNLFLWYTYPNISAKYDNNKLRVFDGSTWKDVTIPTGMYEVEDISNIINREMQNLSAGQADNNTVAKLHIDKSTFQCFVKLNPGLQVDFSIGDLHKLLGLEKKIYATPFEGGTGIINITRGVDKLLVRCNLVERPIQKELRDVLYDILPFTNPGSAIQEDIENVEYYHCKDDVIRSIEIRITDWQNNLIDLSEPLQLKIVLKSWRHY